jgi:serine/threonine-protein kinase
MIDWLKQHGGWGTNDADHPDRFQVDFSLVVLHAEAGAPEALLAMSPGYYLPDCDAVQPLPLPPGGRIEGSDDYTCDTGAGDCHLLVAQGNTLYESYATTVDAAGVHSLCLAVWNLAIAYPPQGRGDGCTSADAAGFPIAPLLINADEVAAAMATNGDLGHALRFILPNARMRAGFYARPASHLGGPESDDALAMPYGSRLRLNSGFDGGGFTAAAQVVLRTLKRYGMVLADGGNVPLTADSDSYTAAKWDTLDFDSHSLFGVRAGDFEIIDTGAPIPIDDCERSNPVPAELIFANGFDAP